MEWFARRACFDANGVAAARGAGMRGIAVAQTFPAAQLKQADLVRERIAELTLADLAG